MDRTTHLKTLAGQFALLAEKLMTGAEDARDLAVGIIKRIDTTLGLTTEFDKIEKKGSRKLSEAAGDLRNCAPLCLDDKIADARAALLSILGSKLEDDRPAPAPPEALEAAAADSVGADDDDVEEDDEGSAASSNPAALETAGGDASDAGAAEGAGDSKPAAAAEVKPAADGADRAGRGTGGERRGRTRR